MLCAAEEKSMHISRVNREDDRLYLYSEAGMYRLEPVDLCIVRITYTSKEDFSHDDKPGIIKRQIFSQWEYTECEREICFHTERLKIVIDRETASFRYCDGEGGLLLQEREQDSRSLEEFTVYRIAEESIRTEKLDTPDGMKEVVREAARFPAGKLFHTRLHLKWQEDEALYGLGQHEEGLGSLRGKTVYVHQANRKIAIPLLVSTKGYGILVDTYSPMIFSDTAFGSYLYTEADPEMDYYFINGGSMDGTVRKYRMLTGKASLLPKWAYGYIQSQERYETQEEILDTAKEYRRREIGLDGIVLDWCSWEGNQWGQKTFDSSRFPDPAAMTEKLHENHVHFMLSIWPNMGEETDNYREFKEKGLMLPGCGVYDALSPAGRELYWDQIRKGLFNSGVDAWWCDSSEPFTPEWNHNERPEPSRLYEEYCGSVQMHLPADKMNAYGLYHAQGIYEGQRREDCGRRVTNLTRSAYTGQQRYGAILWSGDVEASWDSLRRQVAAGLHFCASGLPFWTVDIGGFFIKRGIQWFWKGDYPGGTEDLGYRELFVRWYQWACFLPVFRGHGTDCRRELWHFGDGEVPFYHALCSANRMRYEWMPYIYSLAGSCWLQDESMIKLLAFAYPKEHEVREIMDQYLFGSQVMVCPVLFPMYYEKDSKKIDGISRTRRVYLPKENGWYDYWSNEYFEGGQWIEADAPIERIPLFIREGSILPWTEFAQSTEELSPDLDILVYRGKDCELTLYEDEGDGYGYEQGMYSVTRLLWKEQEERFETQKPENCGKMEGTYRIRKVTVVGKGRKKH